MPVHRDEERVATGSSEVVALKTLVFLSSIGGKGPYRAEVLRCGHWDYPGIPGGLDITTDLLDEMVRNFSEGAKGWEVPVNREHDDERACGWVKPGSLERIGDSLFATFDVTDPKTAQEIEDGTLAYVSSELDLSWFDPEDKQTKRVFEGLGLTNRPYIKRMGRIEPVNLSEWNESKHPRHANGTFQKSGSEELEMGSHEDGSPKTDPSGRFPRNSLFELVAKAWKGHFEGKASLGVVPPEIASAISEASGGEIDVSEYERTVDGSAVRHIAKRHAGDKDPITENDLRSLPVIISSPDSVRIESRKGKLDRVISEKLINGQLVCVEEIRTGRSELALVTLYRRPPGTQESTALSTAAPRFTSRNDASEGALEQDTARWVFLRDANGFLRLLASSDSGREPEARSTPTSGAAGQLPENPMSTPQTIPQDLETVRAELAEAGTREKLLTARLAEAERALADLSAKSRISGIRTRLDSLARAGRITAPIYRKAISLAEYTTASASGGRIQLSAKRKLGDGTETDQLDVMDEVLSLLEELPASISVDPKDKVEFEEDEPEEGKGDDDKIADLAERIQSENPKLTFREAALQAEARIRGGKR